jgi:peptide/nickel transport system permease protein
MPPVLQMLFRRLLAVPLTLLAVSATLYAITLLAPPEVRAQLYLSKVEKTRGNVYELTKNAVARYGLNDPFPVQYARWLAKMATGDWGYSPTMAEDVLPALTRRTPATAELALFSLLVFVPLALAAGVWAGWNPESRGDHVFRAAAFTATAVPPFVMGIVLLSIFYVALRWLPPERLGQAATAVVGGDAYHVYTGMLTLDGLLNGRPDVTWDALRHLILPAIALGLMHWATMARVARAATIEERRKEYVTAARARGLRERSIVWGHVFPNAAPAALTSGALAAATLLTSVFVVEAIFSWHGLSEVIITWARNPFQQQRIPDTTAVMGFAVYSVLAVQAVMLALDLVQAAFNPRLREEADSQ